MEHLGTILPSCLQNPSKKFHNIDTSFAYYGTFFFATNDDKLACLSLGRLSSLVKYLWVRLGTYPRGEHLNGKIDYTTRAHQGQILAYLVCMSTVVTYGRKMFIKFVPDVPGVLPQ